MDERLGKCIASTANADIHELDATAVLKLYRQHVPQEDIVREWRQGVAIARIGLPVPGVLGSPTRRHVDGRVGVRFERVGGHTLLRHVLRHPLALHRYLMLLAGLHRRMQRRAPPAELRDQRHALAAALRRVNWRTANEREQVQRVLATLPAGSTLCHGDYGPENVMFDGRRAVIIDWLDATVGAALGDVARSWVILRFNRHAGHAARWIGRFMARRYLDLRLRGECYDPDELDRWIIVHTAARLSELQVPRARRHAQRYLQGRLARRS